MEISFTCAGPRPARLRSFLVQMPFFGTKMDGLAVKVRLDMEIQEIG